MSTKTSEKERDVEILKLIRKGSRRWTELKKTMGLSSATLYRHLRSLERSKSIEKELKENRLQWKLTEKGRKWAVSNSLLKFFRKGKEFDFDVLMTFDYWQPRTDENIRNTREDEDHYKRYHPEDREFFLLEEDEMAKALAKAFGKEGFEKFRKEKPLLNISFEPKVVVLKTPRNGYKLGSLLKEIAHLMDKNVEKIISSLLPKKTTKYKDGNYFTNEALILFKIYFEVNEGAIDEVLKESSGSVS